MPLVRILSLSRSTSYAHYLIHLAASQRINNIFTCLDLIKKRSKHAFDRVEPGDVDFYRMNLMSATSITPAASLLTNAVSVLPQRDGCPFTLPDNQSTKSNK